MTEAKRKQVIITLDVDAAKWDWLFKLFGGQRTFEIYWSSIAADMITCFEDSVDVQDDYIRWAKEVATERGITPNMEYIPVEWPATDKVKDTITLVEILAKDENHTVEEFLEHWIRMTLETYAHDVEESPEAAKCLVAKWDRMRAKKKHEKQK